jgi:CRP/FNR family transcriptional regulator
VISGKYQTLFEEKFPQLLADRKSRRLLVETGACRELSPGDVLYQDGDQCAYLPLVLSGDVVLSKYGETGRVITLYRVEAGQSCILSALTILNGGPFPARAATETSGTVVLVPGRVVRKLVDTDLAWRSYVFALYQERLVGMIELVQEVVFERLDDRLAELISRLAAGKEERVRRTHQELAAELGTSREVVSRLLKDWEKKGILKLKRGSVELLNLDQLRQRYPHA